LVLSEIDLMGIVVNAIVTGYPVSGTAIIKLSDGSRAVEEFDPARHSARDLVGQLVGYGQRSAGRDFLGWPR
jgi:hypothetical protein